MMADQIRAGPPPAQCPSTTQLVRELAIDVSRLVGDESRLMTDELRHTAKEVGIRAGAAAVGSIVASLAVAVLVTGTILALAFALPG